MTTTIDQEPKPAGWRPPAAEPKTPSKWPLAIVAALVVLMGLSGGWPLLLVVGAIFVMVFLHELGHFLTAKWGGMKVTEFFIGIGPKIWSFRRGETEYGLKAIPFVAYVKIIGMNNLDEIEDPADEPRTYRQQSFPRRLAVAMAGSTMHFLLAIVCIYGLILARGVPGGGTMFAASEAEVERADRAAATSPEWIIDHVTEDSPADRAGLQEGDRIVAVDGRATGSFEEVREQIQDRQPGSEMVLTVERGGETLEREVRLAGRPDDRQIAFLGVAPGLPPIEYNAVSAAGKAVTELGRAMWGTVRGIGQIFSPSGLSDFASQVVEGDARQPGSGGATGGGGGGSDDRAAPEARPISIVGAARLGADLTREGMAYFFLFIALINVFIGVFNLIPLLPLDGGHVAVAVYERLRSRRGQRYHADVAKLLPITYGVVLLMIFVGVASLYLDIADPISLE